MIPEVSSLRGARTEEEVRASGHKRRKFWAKVGILAAIWLLAVVLLNLGRSPEFFGLAPGQRAPETLTAQVRFRCADLNETARRRAEAASKVPPAYRILDGQTQIVARTLELLAEALEDARRDPAAQENPDVVAVRVRSILKAREEGLAVEDVERLFPPGREEEVRKCLNDALLAVASQGIAPEAAPSSNGEAWGGMVDIVDEGAEGGLRPVEWASLATPAEALESWTAQVSGCLAAAGVGKPALETARTLADKALKGNLSYDADTTEKGRLAAMDAVPEAELTIEPTSTLVSRGDEVDEQIYEMVTAHNRAVAESETAGVARLQKLCGDAGLLFIVLVICVSWLASTEPDSYANPRRKWLLATLCVLAVAQAALARYLSVTLEAIPQSVIVEAIPLAFLPILAALLLSPSAALAVGLWGGLAASLAFGRNYVLVLMGLGGAALIAALVKGARRRSQVMRAGMWVGVLKMAIALTVAAATGMEWGALPNFRSLLGQLVAALSSGVLAAALAVFVLPLFERLFDEVTDITLLEFSDMSQPLLRRMAIEAPGTYHHSLMVAAIGEAAATEIGADGLLVAVMAHFHDIGKLNKAEYFTENQRNGVNPHDALEPSMSAMILHSHVKEGIALARRDRLPRVIAEAIACHHGTTTTAYFLEVARRRLADAGEAVPGNFGEAFRYEGPRPWTREQAVLMLADSVEAASRSMEKPTPGKIADLVDAILREKMADHQLDGCPLTLHEIEQIRSSLVFSLTNILHGRSPYPREHSPAQPAANPPRTEGAPDAARKAPGGAGVS